MALGSRVEYPLHIVPPAQPSGSAVGVPGQPGVRAGGQSVQRTAGGIALHLEAPRQSGGEAFTRPIVFLGPGAVDLAWSTSKTSCMLRVECFSRGRHHHLGEMVLGELRLARSEQDA